MGYSLSANGFSHETAPAYGDPTDHTSSRWPSYSAWADFCRFSGLHDLFFGKSTRDDSILQSHSGCIPLTEKHRKEKNSAFEAYKIKYPNSMPIMGDEQSEENYQLCRLTWLHYWVNWALDNCKQPVFENS